MNPSLPPRLCEAIQALRQGRGVLLLDDDEREHEADLVVAAEHIDEPTMALMIRACSGIVCLCLPDATLRRLMLKPMVEPNESLHGTAFTVSIDARDGIGTGVSAADRVATVRAAVRDAAVPFDLVRPGHVFPLRGAPGGVLARRGHTEGALDLVRLAGLKPAAVLCELMNDDGTMAGRDAAQRFGQAHGFPLLTIEDIAAWRRAQEQAQEEVDA